MKVKKSVLMPLLFIMLVMIVGPFSYCYFKASQLEGKYPIWDFDQKKYVLVSKRPKNWVSLSSVSRYAKWAIVISEDWAFYGHKGVDFHQLEKVIEQSLKKKKLTRGASTITQQVIKNTLLSSDKTILRKALELMMAPILEFKMGKNKILEYYLNLVELGRDLYGIKNASFKYFSKHPSKLSAKEGAFLAMLLPSPRRYSQSFRQEKMTDFAQRQVSSILIKLKQAKIITEEQRQAFEKEKLDFEVFDDAIDEELLSIENESYEELEEEFE